MNIEIQDYLTCKKTIKSLQDSKLMCATPVNPDDAVTQVNIIINFLILRIFSLWIYLKYTEKTQLLNINNFLLKHDRIEKNDLISRAIESWIFNIRSHDRSIRNNRSGRDIFMMAYKVLYSNNIFETTLKEIRACLRISY